MWYFQVFAQIGEIGAFGPIPQFMNTAAKV